MTTNLVDQTHWDGGYAEGEYTPLPADDFVRTWVNAHVPKGTGDCLEVGCFPGRYLGMFGDLGYRLHGVDLTPRVEEIAGWLSAAGYQAGSFHRQDFLTCAFDRRFDVVSSFGFIEHFTNWHEVLAGHADLVAPGGYLVIEAPNMAGLVQRVLRRLFEPEDLKRHCTAAMNLDAWSAVVRRLGFDVVYAEPLGNFDFWRMQPGQPGMEFELSVLLQALTPVLRTRGETRSPVSSGYIGLIARRSAEGPPPGDPARTKDLTAIAMRAAMRDRDIDAAAQATIDRVRAWVKYMHDRWTPKG